MTDRDRGSIATGVQAGIGSVAAGSGFAILTSATMAGYGVAIVFGDLWESAVLCYGALQHGKNRGRGYDNARITGAGNAGDEDQDDDGSDIGPKLVG
jgi:hypothetical protein